MEQGYPQSFGDEFLASLKEPAQQPPAGHAPAPDEGREASKAEHAQALQESGSEPPDMTTKSTESGVKTEGGQRRPPKPRPPTKIRKERVEAESQPRRPPQPAKPTKVSRPREAREGGTQTDAPQIETAEKGIQLDLELPAPLASSEAVGAVVEELVDAESDAAEGHCPESFEPDSPDTAPSDGSSMCPPPALIEPQQDMPPLRVRDTRRDRHDLRPQKDVRYFQELPPPEAPPALYDPYTEIEHFGMQSFGVPRMAHSARPGRALLFRELPPPCRPPLPEELALASVRCVRIIEPTC